MQVTRQRREKPPIGLLRMGRRPLVAVAALTVLIATPLGGNGTCGVGKRTATRLSSDTAVPSTAPLPDKSPTITGSSSV